MTERVAGLAGWRIQAAAIVEELFSMVGREHWDDLLELRAGLLQGGDWGTVLDCFLKCRHAFEREAYLPFYRLRTLLAASLSLQGSGEFERIPLPTVELLLRKRHRSFAEWKRQLEREWFEQGWDPELLKAAPLHLVEAYSASPVSSTS